MVLPANLQRSRVAAIVDCPVRGQLAGSRTLEPAAPQSVWLYRESLIGPHSNMRGSLKQLSWNSSWLLSKP